MNLYISINCSLQVTWQKLVHDCCYHSQYSHLPSCSCAYAIAGARAAEMARINDESEVDGQREEQSNARSQDVVLSGQVQDIKEGGERE